MKKFEKEFNYLIELSGKVLTGQIEAEKFEKQRAIFLNEYGKKQQPEIPEFVANHIEATKEDFWTMLSAMDDSNLSSRLVDWLKGGNFRNKEIFAQAWLNGYTVAKEKRFYLKNKLTGLYLALNTKENRYYEHHHDCALKNHEGWKYKFTQQEIDSMETGSYDQVEVEV